MHRGAEAAPEAPPTSAGDAPSSQPMSIETALRLRLPTAREDASVISVPLRIPGPPGGEPANLYLPPGFHLAPDGSFRWGTDAYPLLSGDSQQHAVKSPLQQWWSSYSAADSTAQVAVASSVLNNVLDMRPDAGALEKSGEWGALPVDDEVVAAAGAEAGAAKGRRRKRQHSLEGESTEEEVGGRGAAAAGVAPPGSLPSSDEWAAMSDVPPPLLRPLAAATPLQAYFLPADGVPVPVGGRGQAPVSYFSKAMPRDLELRKVSYTATVLLKTWFARHWENPRPTPDEVETLSRATGLSVEQVAAWFRNERWRFTSDACPLHQRPVYHAAEPALAASDAAPPANDSAPAAAAPDGSQSQHRGEGAPKPTDGSGDVPWAPAGGRLPHALSHHNTVLVRPGSRGALRPRTFLASEGLPLALPDYSILTSDGHVLVPASALPDDATPLGPAVFVAMDAFRGPLSPELQWDASIMRRRGEPSGATGGGDSRRRDADAPRAKSSARPPAAAAEPWVPGTVPPWLAAARFPALPPNVQLLGPDGSVPPGAEFVILPSATGALILAQVVPARDADPSQAPLLVPVATLHGLEDEGPNGGKSKRAGGGSSSRRGSAPAPSAAAAARSGILSATEADAVEALLAGGGPAEGGSGAADSAGPQSEAERQAAQRFSSGVPAPPPRAAQPQALDGELGGTLAPQQVASLHDLSSAQLQQRHDGLGAALSGAEPVVRTAAGGSVGSGDGSVPVMGAVGQPFDLHAARARGYSVNFDAL